MKRPFKKLTAWLCCMAMLISFIPATALPVFADEAAAYIEETDGALTADDFAASGMVKLTKATSASELIEVPSGGNWYLDLNGQTLTVSTDTLFEIRGTLTITDLSDGAAGTITSAGHAASNSDGCILVRGTLNLEGGTITGRTTSGSAGAVYVRGTMNMTGGTITGNTAANGGAIDINASGTVNISGDAVISDNTATGEGGAIRNYGTLKITGGTFSGNTAGGDGGAIANRGTLTFGGTANISTNSASVGGAITNRTTLTINGGTINGNTATAGNGIYNRAGTLSISGDAKIDALQIGAATSATIGNLEPGASVTTSAAGVLTALDSTVNVSGKVYSYQDIPAKGAIMAGGYKLTGDVTLAGALTVAEGVDATIDLAGNTITADLSVSPTYFNIAAGGKLTIKDSATGGKVQFTNTAASSGGIKNYGTFVLEGGELNGWNRSGAGGFIDMHDGATFKMTGGSITGVSATSYSVIRTQGSVGGMTVEITGGEITGNNTTNNNLIQLKGTAAAPNYLTISGTANVSGNTLNGAAFTEEEIRCEYTHITIGGTATVGALYGRGGAEVEGTDGYPYSSIDITGAPTVSNITSNGNAVTPVTITDLTEGASITSTVSVDVDSLDETVAVGTNADGKNVYSYKISTYVVTVEETTGGTVTVDPTEGIDGATVAVTATADEGYELEAVYVDGVEIVAVEGVYTFQIDAEAENVVTATFAEVEAEGFPTSGTIDTDATYVLTENVTMDGVLTIDTDAEVTIDLAGYEIHAKDETNGVFNVLGKLTVLDNSENETGRIVSHGVGSSSGTPAVQITSGSFTLNGGEITGWVREGNAGGMVYVWAGATFNMNGGKLTGASALNGSAIRNAGTVYMNGGEISGNIASGTNAGAAVQVDASGVFEMTNGTIKNNSGTDGGAINNKGTVTISGGTISGNDAKEGGAIFNRYSTATLTISGGTITGNTATASGGAIYNRDAALAISGGTITGNTAEYGADIRVYSGILSISGDAKIGELMITTATSKTIGNLKPGASVTTKANDALDILENDTTVAHTAGTKVYTYNAPVEYDVTEGTCENGSVSVAPKKGVAGTQVTVTATADEGYELTAIFVDDTQVATTSPYTLTISGNHTVTATFAKKAAAYIEETDGALTADDFAASGMVKLTKATSASELIEVPSGGNWYLDLNGQTLTVSTDTLFEIRGTLTITDLSDGAAGTITSAGRTAANSDGCILVRGTLNLEGGTITGRTTSGNAGAVRVRGGGTMNMTGGTISGNAANFGGAIYNQESSTVNISGGTITGNTGTEGGAIYNNKSTVTISGDANISGNTANAEGGAIWNRYDGGTLTISGGTISGNTAPTGGAIYNRDAALAISGGTVIDDLYIHSATSKTIGNLQSGAYVKSNAALTIADNDETVYTADNLVYQFAGDVQLGLADKLKPGATVTVEEGDSLGGGIVLTEAGDYILDLAGQTLTGTAAPYFTIGEGVKLTVIDSSEAGTGKIVGLTNATNAMILVNGGTFSLDGGLLTGNVNSGGYGGAIYAGKDGSVVSVNGGEISGNTARRGGAISGPNTGSAIDVTIEITGGIVTGNATDRGATMYTQTGATVTIEGGKVGFGTINGEPADVTTSGKEDLWIRNSNFAISGGEIGDVFFNGDAANGYTMAITGKTTIHLLNGVTEETATIGNLITGARVATVAPKPLTIVEDVETVHVKNNLYRFIGDVGPVTRILFVGNSFAGDTTTYLNDLGNFFNIEVESDFLYIGSQNIRWHAQSLAETLRNVDLNGDGVIGDSRSSKDELYDYAGQENVSIPYAMTDGVWDYVVLQPGVQYVGYEGTYNSDINFLADYIREVQPTAKILWSQTWAVDNLKYTTTDVDEGTAAEDAYWSMTSDYLTQFGGSQAAMYDAILYNTDKFIAGNDARFADVINGWLPIGIAIQEMRNGYTDDSTLDNYLATRLTRDGFHLSPNAGRMIAGLTVMKTLFPEQVDLTTMTTEDITGLFNNYYSDDYRADTFEATDENVTKLLNAVATACDYAAAGTVPEYDNGTANKQFNPDAAVVEGTEYVAVYENVTEVGQVADDEFYATTGAGKIVVYEDGKAVATIDELWLEEKAGIELTNRYEKLTNKETYYIQADPQAPQLAVIGTTLYMTFDVKLYADEQNTIVNGGIHLISCDTANGDEWTYIGKISDAPMAYGLTALSDEKLILSIADTDTKAVKIGTDGSIIKSVVLDETISEVAFAEVGDNTFALSSNGTLYVSTDLGENWTATGVTGGSYASPDLVAMAMVVNADKDALYVTWSDEAEFDVYGKVWTIPAGDTDTYGWNNSEATVIAEYAVSTAYNGQATGGQPTSVLSSTTDLYGVIKTIYASGNERQDMERTLVTAFQRNLTLESSLTVNFAVPKDAVDAMGAAYAKAVVHTADGPTEQIITIDENTATATIKQVTYYKLPVSVAAKQMGENIDLAVFDSAGNQLTVMDRYSILAYANTLLARHGSSDVTNSVLTRTMVVDMLNYGAAAQVYLNYSTDELVNAHLTEEQQAWATPEQELDENGAKKPTGVTGVSNLSLQAVVELNMGYLASEIPTAVWGKVTYTNYKGNPQSIYIPVTDYSATYKAVKINTLATADVSAVVTCVLCDEAKNEIEGTEMIYSIESYAYDRNVKKPGEPIAILTMNLMRFGVSAMAYLNK